MKIDDCIDWLCQLRSNVFIFMPYVWHKQMKDALTMAIKTMHKYQKIEQIIKDHDNDRMPEDYWYIDRIREVIEDGNED